MNIELSQDLQDLFETVREDCSSSLWSAAVELTRRAEFHEHAILDDEQQYLVLHSGDVISPKVILWPTDLNWACSCASSDDPCLHTAAVLIAIKSKRVITAASGSTSGLNRIEYRFQAEQQGLSLTRWIVGDSTEQKLTDSLTSTIAGIESGRIPLQPISAASEDLTVDELLSEQRNNLLPHVALLAVFRCLASIPHVYLDTQRIGVSNERIRVQARLESEEENAYRIRGIYDPEPDRIFANGAALLNSTLHAIELVNVPAVLRKALSFEGEVFRNNDLARMITQVLPELRKRVDVDLAVATLPEAVEALPKLNIHAAVIDDIAVFTPRIVYGDPPLSELSCEGYRLLSQSQVPRRNRDRELALIQELRNDTGLVFERNNERRGLTAISTLQSASKYQLSGESLDRFRVTEEVTPNFSWSGGQLILLSNSDHEAQAIDMDSLDAALDIGRPYVRLLSGNWIALSEKWFARYAVRLREIFRAQAQHQELPRSFIPEIIEIADENSQSVNGLEHFRERLKNYQLPSYDVLPDQLQSMARSYQTEGIAWLNAMRELGLGAMLADDMGLGKTLQALAIIRGKTLVVAPTSVLFNWTEQAKRFRPGLRTCLYHGPQRFLDANADLILTSYSLLRLDCDILCEESWDMAILDEAQQIKNPNSQIAQAAHRLQANFHLSLTGTPVENSLSDLWSQFHFIAPGLLGTRTSFKERFAAPIAQGDQAAQEVLKRRVTPFILRRLKSEVAKDLPKRTEYVQYVELDASERELYDSILASTRAELLPLLEQEADTFAALEMLLRLRQACCHQALIPGQKASCSAKITGLLLSLEECTAQGHKALVFSQWTSLLDLIEPKLEQHRLDYLRLDGSTRDRAKLVNEFQTDDGPPIFLISLKAGGTGLTLTAADHVFIVDPWWNPAVEDQAADRTHRIGQTKPVFIHKLIARNTVEERILDLQREKQKLSRHLLEGTGGTAQLTREDLVNLLQ